ncbi:hypothetical protein [Brevundimonas naejangsanensis]|uniref:hypothetical protein n=1 Tax=Brevundimonas naejangsanensis TaxID=588932 RepID=UPI0034D5D2D8
MSNKIFLSAIVGVFALAFAAFPAQAAADSEASFTITVVIPPLAAAIAARDSGAVGAWTVLGQGGGLLVDPASSRDDEMTLHYGERNRVNLFSGGRMIAPVSIQDNGGLTAARFNAQDFEAIGRTTSLVMVSAL